MFDSRGIDLTDRLGSDPAQTARNAPLTAYLALGSNLGSREATVLAAARQLAPLSQGGYLRLSSLYETTPVGCGPMPDFVNAVAQLRPLHPPGELLNRVQVIERTMGRHSGHNEPRELDIDIIAVGNTLIDGPSLTLPHPRYASRIFVLIPLQEVAARFHCPATGRPIADLVAGLPSREGIRRISGRAILLREAS